MLYFRFKVIVDGNDKSFCKVFPLRLSLLLKKFEGQFINRQGPRFMIAN